MIDLRLQTLRVLREEGTVTATAQALHLTPSTVSQQLRQLSRDIGVSLLEPEGRRVRLTDAAHLVLEYGDAMHAIWEQAQSQLRSLQTGDIAQVRITGVATAVFALIAPAMAALTGRHPGMRTEIEESPSTDRLHRLLAGNTDVAVIIHTPGAPPLDDPRFEQTLLLDEPQDLAVPRGHRLAERSRIDLQEASTESWIRAGDPEDQLPVVRAACTAAGFTPRFAHSAVDWTAIGTLVAEGFGVCLLPRLVPLPPGGGVVRVPISGPHAPIRRLLAVIRRGSSEGPAIRRTLEALQQRARDLDASYS